MTPQEFDATPLGKLIAAGRPRKTQIGLRYILTAKEDASDRTPVSRVFDLSIDDLRTMVETLDHVGDLPEGYELTIQAVRQRKAVRA